MFDATPNITLETSLLPIAFSVREKSNLEQSFDSYPEQFISLVTDTEISALNERIQVIPTLTEDILTILTQFAEWVARLQTNNALACDCDEPVEVEPLLTISLSGTDNQTAKNNTHQYIYSKDLLLNPKINTINPAKLGHAIVGIASEDSLLSYP